MVYRTITIDQVLRSLRRILKRHEFSLSPRETTAIIEAHNYIESREESDLRFRVITHLDGNPRNHSIANLRVVDIRDLDKTERDRQARRAKCLP